MRVATYNLHGCVGTDGRFDPGRIERVIRRLDACVIAVQELPPFAPERAQADEPLSFMPEGYAHRVVAPTLSWPDSAYGHALFSAHPIVESAVVDISYRRREPRKAIRAVVQAHDEPVQFIAVHLGLGGGERLYQARALLELVASAPNVPTVLLGDLNEWRPWSRFYRVLASRLRPAGRHRTFHSRCPVFALDMVWAVPDRLRARSEVVRSEVTRRASDHLPVAADLRWIA